MGQELQPWKPSTALSNASGYERAVAKVRYSTSRLSALENARKLIGYFANGRPADPDGYINGLADIFEQYPIGIVEECCHITRGVARSCGDFLPSPQRVTDWCQLYTDAARAVVRRGPPKQPRPPLTDEERAIGYRAITKLVTWMKGGFQGEAPTWTAAAAEAKMLPPPATDAEVSFVGVFDRQPQAEAAE